MDANEIRRRFPKASDSFIRANLSPSDSNALPVVERPACNEPLAQDQGQEERPERVLVRFVIARKRCLDPDNCAIKWLLDSLRYCRAIRGDEPEKITIEIEQRKTRKGEQETVTIEVYSLKELINHL